MFAGSGSERRPALYFQSVRLPRRLSAQGTASQARLPLSHCFQPAAFGGGGARFSCGEDSLFFRECLKTGIRIYASPILIAGEEVRTSTWFCGYNEKYFTDKGVLYYYMYGHMAGIAARYYLMRHKDTWCKVIGTDKAMKLLKEGIALGHRAKAEEQAGTTEEQAGTTEEQATGADGQGDGV